MKKYRYMPYGYKLMLSYCFFIVIPVLLIGYIANSLYVQSIKEQTESNVKGTLSQMSDNISYKMEDIIRISDLFYFDHSLARTLKNYEERMGVSFDIDPEIMKYSTIKLILQPFIENILEHAWCADRIHIRIVGVREGDTILFKVIDDGVGISAELLEQLGDIDESANVGYGIRNVNQRIKLYYGAAYGVQIFSKPGIGTTVCIRFPIKT